MSSSRPPDESDFRIGPYRVLRHIAQGGMGAVYEVEDPETGRHYAMKLGAVRGGEAERFGRIHAALSPLSHEGVVKSHTAGVTPDGRAYQLMDFIGGEPAQVFAKSMGRPGDPQRTTAVITVAIHVAEALHYLHTHEIIHRDIKSANVLVRTDRSVCLIDFGSALMPGLSRGHGRFVGTYTYAPPEQLRAESVDARSDLYAFGVLLYRMLSGVKPFDGTTPEALMRQHLTEMPASLDQRLSSLPPRVVELVARLLKKDPAARPQRASDVIIALRESAERL